MELYLVKLITVAATFVIAVVGIYLSYRLRKFTKWFDIGCAFAAGVIIATAFTHMLPEAIEGYDAAMYASSVSDPLLVGGIARSPCGHAHGHHHHGHHHHDGPVMTTVSPVTTMTGANAEPNLVEFNERMSEAEEHAHVHGPGCQHDHHHIHHSDVAASTVEGEEPHVHPYPMILFLVALSFLSLFLVERGAILYMKRRAGHHHHHTSDAGHSSLTVCDEAALPKGEAVECCKDINTLNSLNTVASFALTLAVSLHSVFEGMGLGAAATSDVCLSTFIGIAVHKGLEGFAVGAQLVEAEITWTRFLMFSGFVSLATPLGALIGFLLTLTETTASNSLVTPVLSAIAVGTFLQVATMEFLPRTFGREGNFTLKAVGLAVGFGVMCTMPLWGFEHSH
jgi:zinc transporter ZupT